MPNVIATRSIANEPMSAWLPRTNRRPSPMDCQIPSCGPSPPIGSCGDIASTAATIARQLAASMT